MKDGIGDLWRQVVNDTFLITNVRSKLSVN